MGGCRENKGVDSRLVAAITAALTAAGYLTEGWQIKQLRALKMNPWKRAGLLELMQGRELRRENGL